MNYYLGVSIDTRKIKHTDIFLGTLVYISQLIGSYRKGDSAPLGLSSRLWT